MGCRIRDETETCVAEEYRGRRRNGAGTAADANVLWETLSNNGYVLAGLGIAPK